MSSQPSGKWSRKSIEVQLPSKILIDHAVFVNGQSDRNWQSMPRAIVISCANMDLDTLFCQAGGNSSQRDTWPTPQGSHRGNYMQDLHDCLAPTDMRVAGV